MRGKRMKKIVDDPRLIAKICEMYYNQDMNQTIIAKELSLSRPTVSRLIQSGREQGIVKIIIENVAGIDFVPLEYELEQKFGLKEVIIAKNGKDDGSNETFVGRVAGEYLKNIINDGNTIGISMGSTLREMVKESEGNGRKNLKFFPLIGGMGQLRTELHSNSLAENLAKRYDGIYIPMHAPARVSTMYIRDKLMKEASISNVVDQCENLDIAVVGIGYPDESSAIMATGYYSKEDMLKMADRQVAGDICMQFYDANGKTAPFKKENMVVGLNIKKLKEIPQVIGVAYGIKKISGIKGAIKGKYINTLITDEKTAKALIQDN